MRTIRIVSVLAAAALALGGAPQERPEKTLPTRRESLRKAVDWLLRSQNRNGSWGLDRGSSGDITCTALAALAIMADGTTARSGPDPEHVGAVRDAVEFVLSRGRTMRGDIVRGEVTLIQNKLGRTVHNFFAAVFLTQVYGMRQEYLKPVEAEDLRDVVDRLVARIVQTQEADGSWHKDTFGSLKATCMAWLALRSASSVGLGVENASVDRTIRFIKDQWNPGTRLFDKTAGHGYQSIYSTASCLRVLYSMGEGDSQEALGATEAFMKFVRDGGQMGQQYLTVEGEDYLSAALFTQSMLMKKDKRWEAWFPWITEQLIRRQNPDGSWTSTACITGRTFPTACSILTFQTPNRLLPLCEL